MSAHPIARSFADLARQSFAEPVKVTFHVMSLEKGHALTGETCPSGLIQNATPVRGAMGGCFNGLRLFALWSLGAGLAGRAVGFVQLGEQFIRLRTDVRRQRSVCRIGRDALQRVDHQRQPLPRNRPEQHRLYIPLDDFHENITFVKELCRQKPFPCPPRQVVDHRHR